MVVEDGYEFYNDRTLVTVFSAPKYVEKILKTWIPSHSLFLLLFL